MILQAQRELNLELRDWILIGDSASDIRAGLAVGVRRNILIYQSKPAELYGFSCGVTSKVIEARNYIKDVLR
jgi:histidinol phosphatase-like enzyme